MAGLANILPAVPIAYIVSLPFHWQGHTRGHGADSWRMFLPQYVTDKVFSRVPPSMLSSHAELHFKLCAGSSWAIKSKQGLPCRTRLAGEADGRVRRQVEAAEQRLQLRVHIHHRARAARRRAAPQVDGPICSGF